MKKAKTPRDNIPTAKKLVKPRVPYGTPLKSKVPNAKIRRALVAGPKRVGAPRTKTGKNASALTPHTQATGNRFPAVKTAKLAPPPIADKPTPAPAPPPPKPPEPKKPEPAEGGTGDIDWPKLISAVRKDIKFTEEEYSSAIGVDVATLRRWESGQRKPNAKTQKVILEDVEEHTSLKIVEFMR